MASKLSGIELTRYDDLFKTDAECEADQQERIQIVPAAEVFLYSRQPYTIDRPTPDLVRLMDSIEHIGIAEPLIVRPRDTGGYEIISGHRRDYCAKAVGLDTRPVLVRNYSDEEADILVVDYNINREDLLPSEKAKAYKLKLDAMKRQGQRTDLTSGPVGQKSSRDELADSSPDSSRQIQRYIRLTNLIPEILELVDNSVLKDPEMLQIAMRPAVELSYLRKEEQADLFAIMDELDCTPSHAQAIKMRQMSEAKTGGERLAKDALVSIMKEEKPNQKEQFKIPKERINKYFAPGTPAQKIEDTIIKALELYRKRQRSLER